MAGGAGVLDASAVIAFIDGERGGERVMEVIGAGGAVMSAVNLSEALVVIIRRGTPAETAHQMLTRLGLRVHAFDVETALQAAQLYLKCPDLSLGDRACLALAQNLGLPALTADSAWPPAPKGIQVRFIR